MRIAVDGTLVLASAAPLNTWEPYWGLNATFEARASSTVQIVVLENDLDGSWETIAQWQGTLGELLRMKGRLAFGAVERLSYELEAH